MEKTDRQTDTKARGAWWIITAYNDDILKCEQQSAYPAWVKAVHGGREKCPTTEREHFQGSVNTQQVRWSQLKSWLTQSHIELADSPEAARKYCMKQETAIGAKVVRENDVKFYRMEELLMMLGSHDEDGIPEYVENLIKDGYTSGQAIKKYYWLLVQRVLEEKGAYLIASYSKGDMFSAWENLRQFWKARSEEALSITEPPAECDKISPA